MTTVRKCPATLKLPRLRMKDELLKVKLWLLSVAMQAVREGTLSGAH